MSVEGRIYMAVSKDTMYKLTAFMLIILLLTLAMLAGCAVDGEIDPPANKNNTSSSLNEGGVTPTPNTSRYDVKETIAPGTNSKSTDSTGTPSADTNAGTKEIAQTNTIEEPKVISITISAVGDCTLGSNYKMSYENSFDSVYDRKGKAYFFKNVYDILSKDDFTIANLEGPLTKSNDRQTKLYSHRGKPEYVNILTEGSIEAVSFANNHTYDFGRSGFDDTVNLLSGAGVAYACDDVYGLYETKGIKIGFVSVDEHYDGKLVEVWLEEGISRLRQQGADLVIAAIHWGRAENEKTSNVDEYQVELGNKCIDWGYDLIIGNHVHVLNGINRYKGKYIVYSLGNFSYGGSKNPVDKDTGIFQQTFTFIDGELQVDDNVRFIPCHSSSSRKINNYQPTIAKGEEARRIIDKINIYSAKYGVAFDEDGYPMKDTSLTEKNKSDAYYSIFKSSLKENMLKSVKHIGVDLSALELSDTDYLEKLISEWCASNGYTAFFGTKAEIVAAGYNKMADDGRATIVIFDPPHWSNNQVQCTVLRNITLLNYLREIFTSAYTGDKWETVKGTYIQK
jgi:hypothetical protein